MSKKTPHSWCSSLNLTKSHNHGMAGAGSDLCRPPQSNPPAKGGSPRAVLNKPKEGDCRTPLSSLLQVLCHLTVVFSSYSGGTSCIPVCACWPLSCHQSLSPSSWHLPLKYLYALVRSSLSCLFSRLNSPVPSAFPLSDVLLSLILFVASAGSSPVVPCPVSLTKLCGWTELRTGEEWEDKEEIQKQDLFLN